MIVFLLFAAMIWIIATAPLVYAANNPRMFWLMAPAVFVIFGVIIWIEYLIIMENLN